MSGRVHGGDAEAVAARLGIPVEEIVDFSANINPDGPPSQVLDRLVREASNPRALARYPDPDSRRLREAAAAAIGVEPESIVVGNGSAALMTAVVRALAPSSCLVPVPAFGEYGRALATAGCRMVPVPLDRERGFALDAAEIRDEISRHRPDLCILTNPHNPSGSLAPAAAIRDVLTAARATGATVMLDEAFVDYAPDESLARDAAATPGLVVLRSVTKFFAIPALRVGLAVASPEVAERVRAQMDPWPVTSLAESAAVEALEDEEFARRTRASNEREREWLGRALGGVSGLVVFPSAANFLLLELPHDAPPAADVRERLVREHRLLVRDCGSFEGLAPGRFVRVCVRTRRENERLVAALAKLIEQG